MVQRIFAHEQCSNVSRRIIAESCWYSPYVLKTQGFGFFYVSLYRKQVSLGLKEILESVTAFIKTSKRGRFYQDMVWKRHARNSRVCASKKFNHAQSYTMEKCHKTVKQFKKNLTNTSLLWLSIKLQISLPKFYDLNMLTRISLSGKHILE